MGAASEQRARGVADPDDGARRQRAQHAVGDDLDHDVLNRRRGSGHLVQGDSDVAVMVEMTSVVGVPVDTTPGTPAVATVARPEPPVHGGYARAVRLEDTAPSARLADVA